MGNNLYKGLYRKKLNRYMTDYHDPSNHKKVMSGDYHY